MNLLTLKTIVYDAQKDDLFSPSHTDFAWQKGIIARSCPRCTTDICNSDCTCGIYGSPNPEALEEYAKYPNSVFVVMNTYGWVDIWTAPNDVGPALITRAWGTQIVGVVGTDFGMGMGLTPQRQLTSLKACEKFEVASYPWIMIREMIKATWNQPYMTIRNPFDKEAISSWK